MSIDTPRDLAGLSAIGAIVARVLEAVGRAVRPGISTAELDGLAQDLFDADGATSAPGKFYGFPGAICLSVNEEIVHGVPSLARRIAAGDVVKVDVTAEKDGYVADAARTVAVPPVTRDVQRLIHGVERAFEAAMTAVAAGRTVRGIGRAVEAHAATSGLSVLQGLCGHGIGRHIHEWPTIPNWDDPGTRGRLTRGLVIAVEPMLTLGRGEVVESDDGWTLCTKDGALAAHHENTVVVTDHRPLVLTA